VIDAKLLRSDPDAVAKNLARRGFSLDVDALRKLDERRKIAQVQNDQLRSERNAHAKAVGMAKGRGEDIAPLIAKGDELTRNLAAVDKSLADLQAELDDLVARLLLGEVAHCSGVEGTFRVLRLAVHGPNKHPRGHVARLDAFDEVDAIPITERDVNDDDVGLLLVEKPQGLGHSVGLATDFEIGLAGNASGESSRTTG